MNPDPALGADPWQVAPRALAFTRAGLLLERGLRSFWLTGSLAILLIAAHAFGFFALVPGGWGFWLGAALWLAVAALFLPAALRFRLPSRAEAIARLDAGLPGRPFKALADTPAIGGDDPAAMALWEAHRARMCARAAEARPAFPAPGLARRDPYALRLIALTAGAVALLFAVPHVAEMPGLPGPAGAASGPAWEGWVVPPRHTGRPTLYLNEITRPDFEVPQGAVVTLRLYGEVPVAQSLGGEVSENEAGNTLQIPVRQSGPLSVAGREWQLTVLPDAVPLVSFTGPMERARGGVMAQPFLLTDDFGVQRGEARIRLDLEAVDRRFGRALEPEPREELVLDLPLPMTGARSEIRDTLREDLGQHPWAHLPVVLVLEATDAAGQTGRSEERRVDLPARRFFEPAALAISEIRRDLLWNRDNARRSAQILRAMRWQSEGVFVVELAPAMIDEAVRIIEASLDTGAWDGARRDEVAAFLWELALQLEEGELANARERLRRAQERLDQAMRDGASPAEIAELMDELREATRDYMDMLAEQMPDESAPGDQRDRGSDGERTTVTDDQIRQLMDEIQRLMEAGEMEAAAELMAQLNALLENLQMTRGEGGEPREGAQSMGELGESLGEQQRLADETFREMQRRFNQQDPQDPQGQQGRPRQPSGQEGPDSEPRPGGEAENGSPEGEQEQAGTDGDTLEELADRQEALRERLREQQLGDLPGAGSDEGEAGLEALEDAERAMDEAVQALRQGDARGAIERQAEALEAMREGMRRLREGQSRDRAETQSDPSEDPQAGGQGRDPLGRQRGAGSESGNVTGAVPGEDPRQRARDLMDEIRRRLAERERPEAERDYLDRLIERF